MTIELSGKLKVIHIEVSKLSGLILELPDELTYEYSHLYHKLMIIAPKSNPVKDLINRLDSIQLTGAEILDVINALLKRQR